MAGAPGGTFDTLGFHARFRPDATACVDLASGERLTYRTLHQRALACAAQITRIAGPPSGERIVVLSRNTAMFAVISAACEMCGAVLASLNWRLSAAELSVQLRDCEPALLVCEDEFSATLQEAAALAACAAPVVKPHQIAGPDTPPPDRKTRITPASGAAPCILLYTSGTTGQPKGVVITRENALFSSLNFAAVASVTPASVLLCDAPLFHTVGLVAITRTALQLGACVLLSDRFIPGVTLERISDPALGVTHYFVVPQMVEALLKEPRAAKADFSRLVALFSGGGPLSPELVQTFAQRGVILVNGYGMSEVGSAVHTPLNADYIAANPTVVGFPAPYIDVQITGANGRAVPDGEVGEIWIRGPSVSPGYWRQKEATAASRSKTWFRTGDLGRKQADGAMLIAGRLKDMYISGGENVYPAEVEAVLREIPGVIDAAVIGVPDARWGETGVAFIEAAPAATPLESAVRSYCNERLARYKTPARVIFVDVLPKTGSGKVLKAQLKTSLLKNSGAP
jgi:fatty-acyl-CoA synthase